jgi:hypothetical protein
MSYKAKNLHQESSREGKSFECHIRNHILQVVSYKEFSLDLSTGPDEMLLIEYFAINGKNSLQK